MLPNSVREIEMEV